jgi:hypothetical protein
MTRAARTPPHPRALAAALLTVVPFLTFAVSWLIWRDELPASLTTQWDADGPSSFAPTWSVAGPLAALTLVAATVGVSAAFGRGTDLVFKRRVFIWVSMVAMAAASMWVALAAVAVSTTRDGNSTMGGGFLLAFPIAALYGVVVFFVAQRPVDAPDQYATDTSMR